jgi:exodeoxyribonuclease VIII
MIDLPFEEYLKKQCVSQSLLKALNESPFDGWKSSWLNTEKRDEPTEAMLRGKLFHKVLLEPDTFNSDFYVAEKPDLRTKVGKEDYQVIKNCAGDRNVVWHDDYEAASKAANVLLSDKTLKNLFVGGLKEKALFWKDEKTGIECKARFDCIKFLPTKEGITSVIADYKTINNLTTQSAAREIKTRLYHMQAAFYVDGMKANGIGEHQNYVVVFQQPSEPRKYLALSLDDTAIEDGRRIYQNLIERFGLLLEKYGENPWPVSADGLSFKTITSEDLDNWRELA